VVGRENADIADTLHLRDIAMATNFGTKAALTTETKQRKTNLKQIQKQCFVSDALTCETKH